MISKNRQAEIYPDGNGSTGSGSFIDRDPGEIEALQKGVASKYPMIEGIPELKNEISRFVKNFLNV